MQNDRFGSSLNLLRQKSTILVVAADRADAHTSTYPNRQAADTTRVRHLRNQCKGTIQPFDRWQDQFARLGLNTKALCLGAGFRKGDIDATSIPYAAFVEILAVAEREHGPAFVVDLVRGQTVGDFDLVGYLFLNATTLKIGLESVRDWLAAIDSRSKFELLLTDSYLTCKFSTPGISTDRNFVAAEIAIAALVNGIRRYIGERDWNPDAIFFEHARRENAKHLNGILGENIHFNRSFSGIRFPRELLSFSNPKSDKELFDMLTRRCAPDQCYSDDIVSAVARLVSEGVKNGRLSAEEIAYELAMSKRTLCRRLKEANSSIREIRQATLIPIAKELLSQNLDLSTIAYRLGYSDCRSFARAFKRSVGLAPADYRKRIANARLIPEPSSAFQQTKPRTMAYGLSPRADSLPGQHSFTRGHPMKSH